MRLLERERERLRAKYLEKTAHRTYDLHAYNRWLDWEIGKSIVPLIPFFVALYLGESRSVLWLFGVVGGSLSAFWFFFVTWQWLAVASRAGDKRYNLVTRKYLSKEYRD